MILRGNENDSCDERPPSVRDFAVSISFARPDIVSKLCSDLYPSAGNGMTEFHSLVDLASDAALVLDSKSDVVVWNERAASLLGYARDETLGQPCYDILQAILTSG